MQKPPRLSTDPTKVYGNMARLTHYYPGRHTRRYYIDPHSYSVCIQEVSPFISLWQMPDDRREVPNILLKETDPKTKVTTLAIYICRERLALHLARLQSIHSKIFSDYEANEERRHRFKTQVRSRIKNPGGSKNPLKTALNALALDSYGKPRSITEVLNAVKWKEIKSE